MQAAVASRVLATRVVVLARNATAVVKLGTLLAHVPMVLLTLGMAAAAAAAEATVLLVAVVEVKLGAHFLSQLDLVRV